MNIRSFYPHVVLFLPLSPSVHLNAKEAFRRASPPVSHQPHCCAATTTSLGSMSRAFGGHSILHGKEKHRSVNISPSNASDISDQPKTDRSSQYTLGRCGANLPMHGYARHRLQSVSFTNESGFFTGRCDGCLRLLAPTELGRFVSDQ